MLPAWQEQYTEMLSLVCEEYTRFQSCCLPAEHLYSDKLRD